VVEELEVARKATTQGGDEVVQGQGQVDSWVAVEYSHDDIVDHRIGSSLLSTVRLELQLKPVLAELTRLKACDLAQNVLAYSVNVRLCFRTSVAGPDQENILVGV